MSHPIVSGALADAHRNQLMQNAAHQRRARTARPEPTASRRALRLPALRWRPARVTGPVGVAALAQR
jgi:hypothetical protein